MMDNDNSDVVIPKGTEIHALGQRLVLAKDCIIKNGCLGDYKFTERPENRRAAVLGLRIEFCVRLGLLEQVARDRAYMADWEQSTKAA